MFVLTFCWFVIYFFKNLKKWGGNVQKKNSSTILVWGVFVLYLVLTFTKLNFAASIPFLVKESIFSKTHSGIINGAFYLVYGASQFLIAKKIDRVSPAKIELISLGGSLLCNIALCLSTNFVWVLILWSLNGFFLSFAWPGAVKTVTDYVPEEKKQQGSLMLTLSMAFGGITSYLVVARMLETFGWSGVFIMNTVITVVMTVVWIYVVRLSGGLPVKIKEACAKQTTSSQQKLLPLILTSGAGFVFVAAFVRAALDNGLKTWIPSMMLESYNLSTVWVGMQTAVIYICNIAGTFLVVPLFSKRKNDVGTFIIMLAISLPFTVLMLKIGEIPQLAAIASFMIITTLSFTLNNVSIRISSKFASFGESLSGGIASIMNGFASFGVLVASVLFGYVAENYSWQAVMLCCVGLLVLSILLLVPAYFLWKRFLKNISSK